MDLDASTLEHALETLGGVLEGRRLCYELVAVGGSALLLMRVISRPTKDLDVLAVVESGEYMCAEDLRRLAPSPDELLFAARWAKTQDPSEAFRELLV